MDARTAISTAWQWAQAHPNISIPIGVVIAGWVLARIRWTPELLWTVTRAFYRSGSQGKGFGSFVASLMVPVMALAESPAVPVQALAGIRKRRKVVDPDLVAALRRCEVLEEQLREMRNNGRRALAEADKRLRDLEAKGANQDRLLVELQAKVEVVQGLQNLPPHVKVSGPYDFRVTSTDSTAH